MNSILNDGDTTPGNNDEEGKILANTDTINLNSTELISFCYLFAYVTSNSNLVASLLANSNIKANIVAKSNVSA